MIWVLIGYGCNDVMIPALIWSSEHKALETCKEILGDTFKAGKDDNGNTYRWDYKRGISPQMGAKLYTDYYGGCGECCRVVLKCVQEGNPFVCWNLD